MQAWGVGEWGWFREVLRFRFWIKTGSRGDGDRNAVQLTDPRAALS